MKRATHLAKPASSYLFKFTFFAQSSGYSAIATKVQCNQHKMKYVRYRVGKLQNCDIKLHLGFYFVKELKKRRQLSNPINIVAHSYILMYICYIGKRVKASTCVSCVKVMNFCYIGMKMCQVLSTAEICWNMVKMLNMLKYISQNIMKNFEIR